MGKVTIQEFIGQIEIEKHAEMRSVLDCYNNNLKDRRALSNDEKIKEETQKQGIEDYISYIFYMFRILKNEDLKYSKDNQIKIPEINFDENVDWKKHLTNLDIFNNPLYLDVINKIESANINKNLFVEFVNWIWTNFSIFSDMRYSGDIMELLENYIINPDTCLLEEKNELEEKKSKGWRELPPEESHPKFFMLLDDLRIKIIKNTNIYLGSFFPFSFKDYFNSVVLQVKIRPYLADLANTFHKDTRINDFCNQMDCLIKSKGEGKEDKVNSLGVVSGDYRT